MIRSVSIKVESGPMSVRVNVGQVKSGRGSGSGRFRVGSDQIRGVSGSVRGP
jgi:hypothetical protein